LFASDVMIKITVGSRQVRIKGWEDRHDPHPHVAREYERARNDGRWRLMFRGQQEMPLERDFYYVGQKARPCYHGGDIHKLRLHAQKVAFDSRLFAELAVAYVTSPMPHWGKPIRVDDLHAVYRKSDERQRYFLAQLLIEGLHYQNNQPEVSKWRDYLFVISCTTDYEIALKYALSLHGGLAMQGYVLEYAPPVKSNLYHDVDEVIAQFGQRRLGFIHGNKDAEILVPFAMSPEYLLGHTVLCQQSAGTYEGTYLPNPHYESGRATLERPPDLSDRQRELMEATLKRMAWVSYIPSESGGEWGDLFRPDGTEPIGPPL
jgi:hypothetical protein